MAPFPYVASNKLYSAADEELLDLCSSSWQIWLEKYPVFTYRGQSLRYTARREPRPGGWYWYAYKRVESKLHKRYLGRGEDLTPQRLQEMEKLLGTRCNDCEVPDERISSVIEPPVTRFGMPRLMEGLVARPRLLELFQHALQCPCTLVTAPAGSGKTTLLVMGGEQHVRLGWQMVWLTLEQSEHDPARFWRLVLMAIERELPGTAHSALALMQDVPFPAIEEIVALLINTLVKQDVPLLLILDDYQLVARAEIDHGLRFLVEHLPPKVRLILSSRIEPALPLARWQVRRLVSEIRQEELRFNREEAETFLTCTMGLHLNARQIETLDIRTEGWIAGLQLAARALVGQENIDEVLTNFTGDNRYISEYLFSEVLMEQTSDTRDFLLRTCILSRLCGELCDAVTERDDGQAMLESQETANLFLISLDQQHRWYRYHPLFAEMLRERLRRQRPDWLAESHERAAHWFAARGEIQDAIEHALAAPLYPLALTLIETQIEICLFRGEIATVLTWLQQLPDQALAISPGTSLMAVLIWLMNGEMENAAEVFQRLEITRCPENEDQLLAGRWAVVRGFKELLIGGDIRQALSHMELALSVLPAEQRLMRDMASMIQAAMHALFQEDVRLAIPMITQVAQTSLRHGNYLMASFALENRAIKEISQGRLHQAERTCQDAQRFSLAWSNEDSLFSRWVYLRLGDIYREWNQLERAQEALEYGMSQPFILKYPEIVVDGYIALTRVYDLQGKRARAAATLEELEYLMQSGLVMQHTAWQVEAFQVWFWHRRGETGASSDWTVRYKAYRSTTAQSLPPALSAFSDFMLARIQIAQGLYSEACTWLDSLSAIAEVGGRWCAVIEASLLLALLEQVRGNSEEALRHLHGALRRARPEKFVRLFLDEGQPILDLISRYLISYASVQANECVYARHLLEHADSAALGRVLPEVLTTRELEVLREIATGKANNEIADELFLALSTVKWHVAHIYRKLEVNTRVQAVARARALGLLDT